MTENNIKSYLKSHSKIYLTYRSWRYKLILTKNILKKHFFKIFDNSKDNKKLMVNVGGGYYFRRHWKVMEYETKWYRYSPGVIDFNHNLASEDKFPFKDNSVYLFYLSHTIEHIPQKYCQHIFNEIFRCLKSNGAVRFTNPDFDLGYKAYKEKNFEFFRKYKGVDLEEKFSYFFASYHIVDKSKEELDKTKQLLQKNFAEMSKEEFANYYTLEIPLESQIHHAESHISWWNFEKMKTFLITAGFKNIYLSNPQQSKFHEMRGYGRNTGFDSTHPEFSIFVEAVKD
jgi:predicted SAM-dependent methyltransferase